MLDSIAKPDLYLSIEKPDASLENIEFGREDNSAEEIMGALITQHTQAGSTRKNFLQANKSYEVEFGIMKKMGWFFCYNSLICKSKLRKFENEYSNLP